LRKERVVEYGGWKRIKTGRRGGVGGGGGGGNGAAKKRLTNGGRRGNRCCKSSDYCVEKSMVFLGFIGLSLSMYPKTKLSSL
jgi:hypothetical protein